MNILFLSGWFPYPANNGSKLRIYNLLRGLAKYHDVTLLSFTESNLTNPDTSALKGICRECITVPSQQYNPKSRRAQMGFLSAKPRSVLDTHSAKMEEAIHRLTSTNQYDLVIASQLSMASYFESFKNIPAIFEEIELGIFYEQAYSSPNWLQRFRRWLTWFKLRTYMAGMLDAFASCTVVSDKEKAIFIESFPQHKDKVVVIPNCIDVSEYRANDHLQRKVHHLIFSGSFRYLANYDAMLWFLQKVYPLVLKYVPDTELLITGDHAGLPLPMTHHIECTGYVEDIKSLIASCDVSIAPIWSGGGTRLKILEAMAAGTPVVATSKGAEGLRVVNQEHLLIADEPEEFATHIIKILENDELGKKLASNALQLVKEQYDWDHVLPKFFHVMEDATRRAA